MGKGHCVEALVKKKKTKKNKTKTYNCMELKLEIYSSFAATLLFRVVIQRKCYKTMIIEYSTGSTPEYLHFLQYYPLRGGGDSIT